MAVDFDFDGTFNNEGADDDNGPEEEPTEEATTQQSPLRRILLLLVVLVALCCVCGLVFRQFGLLDSLPFNIPGITTGEPEVPTPVPPTDTAEVPPEETAEPVPGTEEATEEPPATEEVPPPATEEPPPEGTDELPATIEPTVVVEPTDEIISEHDETPIEPTATTVPVPGPTSTPTPGPTVAGTIEPGPCDTNTPPTADANGPYAAMRGKGQAFVTFDGTGSSDPDGTIVDYEWDFGDGNPPEKGAAVTHGYTSIGNYVATLTVTDNCGDTGQDTAEVAIAGPTPPTSDGDDDGTATPTPTPNTDSTTATLGFCYRVQYGDTLSGIAWYYGVPSKDLAAVNGVSSEYLVIAGQGLFIPSGELKAGPNAYQVQSGDTLNSIAYQCGLTVTALAQANSLSTDANLTPGQIIDIPLWINR